MGMGMGGNGKPHKWEWELPALPWEFITKGLCCDELIKLLVLYLPDDNAYCAEFAEAEPECERF